MTGSFYSAKGADAAHRRQDSPPAPTACSTRNLMAYTASAYRYTAGARIGRDKREHMSRYLTPQCWCRPGIIVRLVASASCTIGCFQSTLAQDSSHVTIDAGRCRALESPDERLACFEAEVDAALIGELRESAPQPPAAASAPPQGSQQSLPTVDVAGLPRQDAPADAPGQSEWVGNIASLRERAPNQYLITLDSGQVWLQRLAERYQLRVGQRVRIYQSKFGSGHRLQADGVNGFIQVDRVP